MIDHNQTGETNMNDQRPNPITVEEIQEAEERRAQKLITLQSETLHNGEETITFADATGEDIDRAKRHYDGVLVDALNEFEDVESMYYAIEQFVLDAQDGNRTDGHAIYQGKSVPWSLIADSSSPYSWEVTLSDDRKSIHVKRV